MSRLAAKIRCNYYPLPDWEAESDSKLSASSRTRDSPHWTPALVRAGRWRRSQHPQKPSGMGSNWIHTARRQRREVAGPRYTGGRVERASARGIVRVDLRESAIILAIFSVCLI